MPTNTNAENIIEIWRSYYRWPTGRLSNSRELYLSESFDAVSEWNKVLLTKP